MKYYSYIAGKFNQFKVTKKDINDFNFVADDYSNSIWFGNPHFFVKVMGENNINLQVPKIYSEWAFNMTMRCGLEYEALNNLIKQIDDSLFEERKNIKNNLLSCFISDLCIFWETTTKNDPPITSRILRTPDKRFFILNNELLEDCNFKQLHLAVLTNPGNYVIVGSNVTPIEYLDNINFIASTIEYSKEEILQFLEVN